MLRERQPCRPSGAWAARIALVLDENWEALLLAIDGGAAADEELALACECGRAGCAVRLLMTVDDYRRAHAHPSCAAVGRGHVDAARMRLVERRPAYDLVVRRDAGCA